MGWLQEGGATLGKAVSCSPEKLLERDSPESFQPPTFVAVGRMGSEKGAGAGPGAIHHSDLL